MNCLIISNLFLWKYICSFLLEWHLMYDAMALMLSLWSEVLRHTAKHLNILINCDFVVSHVMFYFREDRKTACYWKVITTQMKTPVLNRLNWSASTHCFVWPVVLLKDVLSAILATVCEHHYHLIAVCSGSTGLLWEAETGMHKIRLVGVK